MSRHIYCRCRKCHRDFPYIEWDTCPGCHERGDVVGASDLGDYIVSLEKRIRALEGLDD